MRQRLSIILFFLAANIYAEVAPGKFFIKFTDKTGTPYSISNPQAFLTQRSIDRRNAQGIAITEQDLPVNPVYVTTVANAGVTVLTITKWFNGVTIFAADTSKLAAIRAMPFVQQVMKSPATGNTSYKAEDKFKKEIFSQVQVPLGSPKSTSVYDYGGSFNQIHMLNGDLLHNMGYRGQGMVIAVLDGGFSNADVNPVFDSIRNNGQILGTKDFVNPGGNVYGEAAHGAEVLSTMGGNMPGFLIGTAPKASFWLLRSEDVPTENIIEEYNWVCAAEFADSVGADVINSSLGYSEFDNPAVNHTCADMNGYTAPSTQGANIAASKGIFVVNSAGNTGGGAWTCVSAPSDGTDVLCIAAVDAGGGYAWFSSPGTIQGNYVKPNVAAQGYGTTVAMPDGSIVTGSGTSFSSPVTAGMVACLWQSRPDVDRNTLMQAIQESASQYSTPDTLLGYGIPDFNNAFVSLSVKNMKRSSLSAYPNPFLNEINIRYFSSNGSEVTIEVFDGTGRRVSFLHPDHVVTGANIFRLEDFSGLQEGIYLVKLSENGSSETIRMIKTR